jgi:hypothetical protein
VLVVPVLLLAISAVFQCVLYFHALQAAHIAADQGLTATAVVGGTSAAGENRALDALSQLGSPLGTPSVSAARGSSLAIVSVNGGVTELVPGLALRVHATAAGPIEAFSTP